MRVINLDIKIPTPEKNDFKKILSFFLCFQWEVILTLIIFAVLCVLKADEAYYYFIAASLSLLYFDIWTGLISMLIKAFYNVIRRDGLLFLLVVAIGLLIGLWINYIFAMLVIFIFLILGLDYIRGILWMVWFRVIDDIFRKKSESWLLVLLFLLMLVWGLRMDFIFLVIIFFSFLFFAWSSRITVVTSMFFIVTCPILLILKNNKIAEMMAAYSFYFLAMTIGLELISLNRVDGSEGESNRISTSSWLNFKISNIFKVEIAPSVAYSPKIEIVKVADNNEIVSDYRQYLQDLRSYEVVVKLNRFNDIFNSFIGWMADAVRITGRALSGNFDNIKREVVKMEKVVYTVPKMATSAVLAAAPDFTSFNLGKKVWRFIKIAARVVFTWQIFANLAVAGVCLSFSYGALMAGDTAQLIIKLGLSLFLVVAVNAIIYLNRK